MTAQDEIQVTEGQKEEGVTSADYKSDEKKDFLAAPNKDENPASEATSVTGIDDIDAEKGEQVDITEEAPPRDISGWKVCINPAMNLQFRRGSRSWNMSWE